MKPFQLKRQFEKEQQHTTIEVVLSAKEDLILSRNLDL